MSGSLIGTEHFIHIIALPPLSTGSANTGVATLQTALSGGAACVQIEAYICTALWFQLNVLEACIGELGVPVLSALQLAKQGDLIWVCFIKRVCCKGRHLQVYHLHT
jgi:hypothetical protein